MLIRNGYVFRPEGRFEKGDAYILGNKIASAAGYTAEMFYRLQKAADLPDGEYSLGGQKVFVRKPLAKLTDGTIAGSCTDLMSCLKISVKQMGISLESAVKCAAVNPAKVLGIYGDYGSLDVGKTANIALLDEDLNPVKIIQEGHLLKS